MNFEFDDEQRALKDHLRKLLAAHDSIGVTRRLMDGDGDFDRVLWKSLAELGVLGAAIPESYGGSSAGYLALCAAAEELGRGLASVPTLTTLYLAARLILTVGTEAQRERYLPAISRGELVACLAVAETPGRLLGGDVACTVRGGLLSGSKGPVLDATQADIAIVLAKDADNGSKLSLQLVDMNGPGVTRESLASIDPARGQGRVTFDGAPAERLGGNAEAMAMLEDAFNAAAVLLAFEQVGGAERALEMAREYALQRQSFGRAIATHQAIKHKLADMFVAVLLARSNAYFGAWALDNEAPELELAAAHARVSASHAFQLCANENTHIHGAMGFTWDMDCHLFFRRANQMSLALDGQLHWQDRLIEAHKSWQVA